MFHIFEGHVSIPDGDIEVSSFDFQLRHQIPTFNCKIHIQNMKDYFVTFLVTQSTVS